MRVGAAWCLCITLVAAIALLLLQPTEETLAVTKRPAAGPVLHSAGATQPKFEAALATAANAAVSSHEEALAAAAKAAAISHGLIVEADTSSAVKQAERTIALSGGVELGTVDWSPMPWPDDLALWRYPLRDFLARDDSHLHRRTAALLVRD
eukprot:6913473-Prymnesium_polylepis.1